MLMEETNEHGQVFEIATAKLLSEAIHAADKMCFTNAFEALVEGLDRRLFDEETVYVEGWVEIPELPILPMHGWLETGEGKIVETTPGYMAEIPKRRYHALFRYSVFELAAELDEDDAFLPLNPHFRLDAIPPEHRELWYEIHERAWGPAMTQMMRDLHERMLRARRGEAVAHDS